MDNPLPRFLGEDLPETAYADSEVVVLPLPFERTTSYGHGTDRGPEGLLIASGFVELYDEELGLEPMTAGHLHRARLPCPPPKTSARRWTRWKPKPAATWRPANSWSAWAASTP